jgi:hypothetical protein
MIIGNRGNSVVATDFDAETQTLLGCGGHDNAMGTLISSRAVLIKDS